MITQSRRNFLMTLTTVAGSMAFGINMKGVDSEGLYLIRQLRESAMLRMYITILKDACQYADRDWQNASFNPAAGYWGNGVSIGNGGIRTIASMLFACVAILKYDHSLGEARRQDLFQKSQAALRYAVATHRTGSQRCTDGKQWGATPEFGPESWQSGMWTGTLAIGTWLLWDRLDAALQHEFQRVIAWEDDILSHRQPPSGLHGDTKAEENGWQVPCLVLGELMFPSHPHAAAWHEAALKYMMNTLCTEADTRNGATVDGRPVDQWMHGANLYPDFTLENHNIFHPAYVACSSYFLTQAEMYFTYARRPIPQAATHHLIDTWRMFQTIILPWSETAYPQGMDWELHGLPYINLYASLATHWQDPFAARMEQCSLQYIRAWQEMGQGSLAIPGSTFGIVRHAINAEQAAYGFMAHKVFGPAANPISAHAAAAQEQGVRDYPYVDFIAHRTLKKFASFSWKNRIMGLLMPIGEGHVKNPDFTVPIQDGFVGLFEVAPRTAQKPTIQQPTVLKQARKEKSDGFETSGILLLHGGRLKQSLRMTSIGSQTVVYEDHVTAQEDVVIEKELGAPIGIENDAITGGMRQISSETGQRLVDWKKPQQTFSLSGSWVNVDDRLGAVAVAGSGLAYTQASQYSPGIAVYTDMLYGSYCDRARRFKSGQTIAHRIVVFFVEVTPKETSVLAQACRIEKRTAGSVLLFKQPSGENIELPLLSEDLV